MKRLSHLCLHVKDMGKAVTFYKNQLGLKVLYQDPIWSELGIDKNISLALYKTAKKGSGLGYLVDNCEQETKKLEAKGIKMLKRCEVHKKDKIILTQFKDADGNIIWLSQRIKK